MDDNERAWLREKLYEHAAELGAQKAEQRAQAADVVQLRQEVRDGLASVKTDMAAHYNHIRGEIASLREEERRRNDDLISGMEEREARAQRVWRVLLLIGGVIVLFGQAAIEHLPTILSLLAQSTH